MIKIAISILLGALLTTTYARGEWNPETEGYIVVSDSIKNDVPKGLVRIKGQVTSNYGDLSQSTISNLNRTHHTVSDSLGNYEFYIPAADTSIFFYKKGYEGVVVWSYPFTEGHEVTINFYINQSIDISFKPVLYCYSDVPLRAEISLNPKGEFTFTYPEYQNGWDIEIKEDSKTYHKDAAYPYLFWEGLTPGLNITAKSGSLEGVMTSGENLATSLDHSLTQLGLNFTERTDFITFWAPKLVHSKHLFYQILTTEEYDEQIAELEVYPKPDKVQRVYFLFTEIENPTEFKVVPQNLETFERKGFTIVEWGGSILDSIKTTL